MKIQKNLRPAVLFVLFCFLAGALWIGYLWYLEKQNTDEHVMTRLSKIIVLPEEIPTIATVTDKEKLNEQPFLAKAENGDKIIIYMQAKRAYLYRPAEHKIIDMTVVVQEGSQATSGSENIPVFQTNN